MKHARADYARFQDPAGKIPENEPVILFRAQDVFFPAVCRFYADLCERNHLANMATVVRDHAALGEAWPTHKFPDLPADMPTEIKKLNDVMSDVELKITNLVPDDEFTRGLTEGSGREPLNPDASFVDQMLKKG